MTEQKAKRIRSMNWDEEERVSLINLNSRPRDLRQLQTQWKHMKMNASKVYSDYNRELKKTGGGQGPTIPDEIVMEIKDIMNPADLLRDYNVYDSDDPVTQLSTYEMEPITSEEVDTQLKSEEFTEVESEQVEIEEMKQVS
ncbi:unnamed protein product [Diabrotica balteata]|uniref:Regulatory protein zeste n=1 Tax=Diabrotica balteata TaxID=107213 RepID=A0A9N9TAU7_DIABA|nr:unnamed protein product [Diabrotica balteata]